MSRMPISPDVAAVVGDYGERIENRSLLFDKFAIPKEWMEFKKGDDLNRASLIRISDGGSTLISELKAKAIKEARHFEKEPDSKNRQSAQLNADIYAKLEKCSVESSSIHDIRKGHTRRLLQLFRQRSESTARTFTARLEAALALNLSDGLIENGGMPLDRVTGLPYIPGSALKGCARHAAIAEIREIEDPQRRRERLHRFHQVFGSAEIDFKEGKVLSEIEAEVAAKDLKGGVVFLPAYPFDNVRIAVDLSTVHTPDYYSGPNSGKVAGLKNEKLRPNAFPVVQARTAFGFVLDTVPLFRKNRECSSVLEAACEWLQLALTVHGIGAKTAAGFGWFSLTPDLDEQMEEEAVAAERKAAQQLQEELERIRREAEEKKRIEALTPEQRAAERFAAMDADAFAGAVSKLDDMEESDQRGLFQVLTTERKDRMKKWRKSKKPTDQERIQRIEAVAKKLNIQLP